MMNKSSRRYSSSVSSTGPAVLQSQINLSSSRRPGTEKSKSSSMLLILVAMLLMFGFFYWAVSHKVQSSIVNDVQNAKYFFNNVVSGGSETPNLRERPPVLPPVKPKRKRYAYAITITKDGFFQDGAAVLAYSIMKYSWNATYDISFVAFVHPNVTLARPGLAKLGFHVIEVPIPVNRTAIKFDFLREKIDKNGCCGSAEMIKVTAYRLTQYERVIHLDADVIFLNVKGPIDLFDSLHSAYFCSFSSSCY
jgi:hypothetical protein